MARYRHTNRSAVLNLTIVGLAAATATLWIAGPDIPKLQTALPHVHPPSLARHPGVPNWRSTLPGGRPGSSAGRLALTATPAATITSTPAATATTTPTPTALAATETPIATASATPSDAATPEPPPDAVGTTPPDAATPQPPPDAVSAPADAATPEVQAAAPAPPPAPAPAPAPAPPPPPAPRYTQARAAQTAYLRTDPTVAALIIGSLPPGTVVTVTGCAVGCTWLLVTLPGGGQAWSESYFYSVLGTLGGY